VKERTNKRKKGFRKKKGRTSAGVILRAASDVATLAPEGAIETSCLARSPIFLDKTRNTGAEAKVAPLKGERVEEGLEIRKTKIMDNLRPQSPFPPSTNRPDSPPLSP
jgi:hypothetical protein